MPRFARAILSCLFLLALSGSACASPMPPFRAATTSHGKLSKLGEHWVMELDGSPEVRGKAAGALLGEQIRWLLPRYMKRAASTSRLSPSQKEMVAAIAAGVPEASFNQLNAMAESAGVDRTELFAVNLSPEVFGAFACSAMGTEAERSTDGKVRLARNLDWKGGELMAGAGLIVIESGGAHRFASFTWPGLVGVVTGMNDAGLTVADLMALGTGKRAGTGVPVLFAVRGMLEQTDSVDAALSWLEGTTRTLPQNYALADQRGARVVETSAAELRTRPVASGLATITNFWHEEQGRAKDGRYAGMVKAAGKGKLGVVELQRILAGVALGGMNVQAVVLEPEARRAHVAQSSKPPVAGGSWTVIDLSPWLGGGTPNR